MKKRISVILLLTLVLALCLSAVAMATVRLPEKGYIFKSNVCAVCFGCQRGPLPA